MSDERIGEYVEGPQVVWPQGLFEESSTQKIPLGAVRDLKDGRAFVYCKNGGVALAAGKLCQAPAPVAAQVNMAVAAAVAVGERKVTVTNGATAVAADQYKDGWLYINDVDGAGYQYKVKNHPANAGSSSLIVYLYDKIRVALTTNSKATLSPAPSGVIVHPNPPTGYLVGIPVIAVTIGYYYWSQVKGPAVCLCSGTPAINSNVKAGGAAGAITIAAEAEILFDSVGFMMDTGVDAKYKMIMLSVPGF